MNKENYLNLDSINGTSNSNDPFDTTLTFGNPVKNLKELMLCSIEIPNAIYNIRNNYNTFLLNIDNSTYTITLDNGNYTTLTDANSLLTATNIITALNSKFSELGFTDFVASISQNKLTIQFNDTHDLTIIDTNLSKYILGFSSSQSVSSSTSITADYIINLNFDTYINMYIPNISGDGANNRNLCTFKIQLNSMFGTITYTDESTSYKQKITCYGNKTYNYFNIQFYDRLGYKITSNNNQHYSVTFRLIYSEN